MRIINASYQITKPDLDDPNAYSSIIKEITEIGHTAYKSTAKITDEKAEDFVRRLIRDGHESVLEHVNMRVKFIVDRGVSHELVRHRLASYTQESTRYCVAGDSKLGFSNPHVAFTIKELYQNSISSPNNAWKRMRIKQYNEDSGQFIYSPIKNIFYNGKKEAIKIRTRLGYTITCTNDHEIYTPYGYRKASELKEQQSIYVNGTNALYTNYDWLFYQSINLNKTFVEIAKEFGFNASTVKKWAYKLQIPKKGTGYFNKGHIPWNKGITDERQANALRAYHHCGRRKDKILKTDTSNYWKHKTAICQVCGKTNDLEVHHIDCDHTNNSPDNLITLCSSCHQRIHSRNLMTAYADQIISIENAGSMDVYDIEMDSSYHNFVANGVVVHNCNYSQDKFENEITVIRPCFLPDCSTGTFNTWSRAMVDCENAYFMLLHQGCTPQEARSVLPNSLKTEVVMTTNFREWRHILNLRAAGVTGKPHPQMLEIMVPLLNELRMKLPALFEDILPMEEQP